MRRAIFLVTILLAMSIPYVQADSEEGVLFTWSGDANTVELVGEWGLGFTYYNDRNGWFVVCEY